MIILEKNDEERGKRGGKLKRLLYEMSLKQYKLILENSKLSVMLTGRNKKE